MPHVLVISFEWYSVGMEIQRRRSRMRRTRTGKRIELTRRDIEIFKLLSRYRYLRSTYIHAFVGGASETRFKERLGDLFHEGYLDRPPQQWEFADARHTPVVHESGRAADQALRACGMALEGANTPLADSPHRQFLHSLMICETLASLDLGVRATAGLRLIGWPEILGRAPDATRSSPTPFRIPVPSGGYLVPDGLFGIEYSSGGSKSYRFFALEADRGTVPIVRSSPNQSSYLGKIGSYREIIVRQVHKTYLGLPNLLVLTLTTSQERMTGIMGRLQREQGDNATFLFGAIAAGATRTPMPLLTAAWRRAGFSPLRIDE
ncbi:MAG: replication-relaxation family protein [Rhizomicrobium sp.]